MPWPKARNLQDKSTEKQQLWAQLLSYAIRISPCDSECKLEGTAGTVPGLSTVLNVKIIWLLFQTSLSALIGKAHDKGGVLLKSSPQNNNVAIQCIIIQFSCCISSS